MWMLETVLSYSRMMELTSGVIAGAGLDLKSFHKDLPFSERERNIFPSAFTLERNDW